MTTKFKAIFFDNDGLLVDTESMWLKATNEALASTGIEIPEDWYTEEVLGKGRKTFDYAKEAGVPEGEIAKLRQRRNDLYLEILKKDVRIMDGVRETLEKLKGKFIMGVVTSSRQDHFDIIMEKTGLREFFSFVVTQSDVSRIKPDPEPYLKALEGTGVPKEECLVLEDSHRGVQAAKAAGLTCYAIPERWTREHDFSLADKVLDSIRELPDILAVQ